MVKNILALALLAIITTGTAATAKPRIAFKNGVLKIAQFTDIHWTPLSARCTETADAIRSVIESERPDLAVLTGDIVTDTPAMDGWRTVTAIFEDARLPFAVVMGNHDAENAAKDDIYELLSGCSYYVGDKGPDNISGKGNSVIAIGDGCDDDGKPKALVYLFDSNDYPADKSHGAYDKIHFDQIAWYRQQSERYTRMNGGRPLPALAFFHIPLPEFNELEGDGKTYGRNEEGGIAAADVNSGMFSSMLDMNDVMGVFVGHDHNNDFIGIDKGILLGYGRVSGYDAYGTFRRGARIIKLYEGKRKMDTWITTSEGREPAYYYPSGLNAEEEDTMTYLPAIKTGKPEHGVAYTYRTGKCKSTADIAACTMVKSGTMNNFSIAEADSADHFAYEFDALINIPVRGVYRFYTRSDDGSALLIDGKKVVDNDGGHSAKRAEGKIALEAGYHRLSLLYFEDYMGQELEVGIAGRHIDETAIPDDMLYLPE